MKGFSLSLPFKINLKSIYKEKICATTECIIKLRLKFFLAIVVFKVNDTDSAKLSTEVTV